MTALLNPPRSQSPATTASPPLVLEPPRYLDLPPLLLVPGQIRIGTGPECQVRLETAGVAAEHASLLAGTHRVVLRAVDPRTWLNDGPVKEAVIRSGDRIALGPVCFRIRRATADELLAGWPAPDFRTLVESTPSPEAELPPPSLQEPLQFDPSLIATARGPAATDGVAAGWTATETSPIVDHLIAEITTADVESPVVNSTPEPPAATPAELPRQPAELNDLRPGHTDVRSAAHEETPRCESPLAAEAARHAESSAELMAAREALENRDRQLRARSEALDLRENELRGLETAMESRERELAAERQRISELAEFTRLQIQVEATRRTAEWTQWEDQQQRHLAQSIEQTAALTEQWADLEARQRRLDDAEQEQKRRREELDQQVRDWEAERNRLAADQRAFQAEREAWATQRASEQEQHLTREQRLQLFEQEVQLRSEHVRRQQEQLSLDVRERARSHTEFEEIEQQLQRDRRLFTEQQASWQQERETAWQDIAERRRRLDTEADRLQAARHEIERLEQALEAEVQEAANDRTRWQAELETLADRTTAPPPVHSASIEQEVADAAEDQWVEPSVIDESPVAESTESTAIEDHETAVTEAVDAEDVESVADTFDDQDTDADEASDTSMDDVQAALDALAERFEEFSVLEHRLSVRHDELLELQQDLAVREAELNAERESLGLEQIAWEADRTVWEHERTARETAAAEDEARQIAWEIARQAALAELKAERQRWAAHLADLVAAAVESRTAEVHSAATNQTADTSSVESGFNAAPAVEPTATWSSIPEPPPIDAPWLAHDVATGTHSAADQQTDSEVDLTTLVNDRQRAEDLLQSLGLACTSYAEPIGDMGIDIQEPSSDATPDVRSELARMFNLPGDFVARQAPADELCATADDQPPADMTGESASESEADADPNDWREQLSATLAQAESAPTPDPTPAAAPEPVSTSHHGEDDSIAAYMEQMLARNRQRVGEGASEFLPLEPEPVSESESVAAKPVAPPPMEPLPPRPKIDHAATRASLESFRDVANRSARSALALHTFNTTKTELAVQTTLLFLSSSGAVLLFTAPLRGGTINLWPALGCSLAAMWMGHRVWQSWRSMNRWRMDAAPANSSERNIADDSDIGESSPLDASEDPAPSLNPSLSAEIAFDSASVAPSLVAKSVNELAPPPADVAAGPVSSSFSGSLWDNVWSDPAPTAAEGEESPRSGASL